MRDYASEYKNYQGSPEQKARRAARGRARYKLMKQGRVRLGDGKDVIHKSGNPLNNNTSNLGVQPKSTNRSYPRTKTAKKVNKSD